MKTNLIWRVLSISVVGFLVVANIGGWLLEDDEGTGLYAMWRFSEGAVPYQDFASTNAPLFLLVGCILVGRFGRNLVVLRLISATTLMASTAFLAWAIGRVWGNQIAVPFWCVTLLTPEIYHLARVFRTDSLMLVFTFLALGCVVVHLFRPKRWILGVSAFLFGLAALSKVVVIMPVLGVAAWLAWLIWTDRRRPTWRDRLVDLFVFCVVSSLVVIAGYGITEFFVPQAVSFVVSSPGAYSATLGRRILLGLVGWVSFITNNWVAMLGIGAAIVFVLRGVEPTAKLWLFQIAGSAPFFLLSSPPYPRYLAYVTPSLVILFLAWFTHSVKLD